MQNKVGFGIIGLGAIADTHFNAIASNKDVAKLIGVFDVNEKRVKEFSSSHDGCKGYIDLDDFLNDKEIEVVTIATPSGYHLESAIKAIRAKKNVLIEKPIEITSERCSEILEEANKNNVLVSGIFQSRFYKAPRLIKEAIDKGRFGKIALINAEVKWFRSQEYYDSGTWRGTWKVDGGGALMNQSIHAIDLLCWFGGKIEEVQAYTTLRSHERIEVEDTGVAILKLENGALGIIEGSTSVYPGFLKKIEILGSEGSAVLEEESLTTWKFVNETPEDERIREEFKNKNTAGGGASDPKAISFKGHQMQFADFALAVREKRKPFITGESAAVSVSLINAIYKSAKEHKPITL